MTAYTILVLLHRELLQTHTNITIPWPVTPTKPVPPSATKILIDAVLPDEEDDDEEYQPAEEDEVVITQFLISFSHRWVHREERDPAQYSTTDYMK
jgi:hypothetical protein